MCVCVRECVPGHEWNQTPWARPACPLHRKADLQDVPGPPALESLKLQATADPGPDQTQ